MKIRRHLILLAGIYIFAFPLLVYAEPQDTLLAIGEGGLADRNYFDYQMSVTAGRDGGPSVTDQREDSQFVVARSSADTWSAGERVARFHMNSPVTIPGSGLVVPSTLWTAEAGGGYRHRLKTNNSVSASLAIGSASDELFNSIHEMTFRAAVNYRHPVDVNHAWLFFLAYSNNRHFANGIPLPGFAYYFNSPAAKIRGVVGFPFASIRFDPTPQTEGTLSIFGPRHFSAEAGYRVIKPLQTYLRYERGQQEWLRADRPNNSAQLFFDTQRAMVGARLSAWLDSFFDLAIGREFQRRFFENDKSTYNDVPSVRLPDAAFIQGKFSYRFGKKL